MSDDRGQQLKTFRDSVLRPPCAEFAQRIGAEVPSELTGSRAGYEITLPSGLKDNQAKTVTACAEPFDDEAFTVKVSRPDMPDQLRQVALVRYDALTAGDGGAAHAGDAVANALEQIHQGLTNR